MRWGRGYFAAQAVAGAVWWALVAGIPWVRTATLGDLDPLLVALFDVPLFVLGSALAAAGVRAAAWIATLWTFAVTAGLAVYATVTTAAGWGVLAMVAASVGSSAALLLVTLGRIPTEYLMVGPFRIRPARPRVHRAAHVAATGAQLVIFWGAALALVPAIIAFLEARWLLHVEFGPAVQWVGGVALLLCSALGIWSAIAMSTAGHGTPLPIATATRLVVSGPYRYVRNPMAVAGIGQGIAVGLVLSSWLVVVYALLGSVVWNHAIRPHEERDLEQRFGDAFRAYRESVRCWIPRFPAASAPSDERSPFTDQELHLHGSGPSARIRNSATRGRTDRRQPRASHPA